MLALDASGNLILWNAAAQVLLGWTDEEIIGCSAALLMPAGRIDELNAVMRTVVGNHEQMALESVWLHKDRSQILVSCRMSPLTDQEGRGYGVSAVVRDIPYEVARRPRHTPRLQEAQEQYDHSANPQLTADRRGVITSVNPAMRRLVGWSSHDAVLGRSVLELMTPEDVEQAVRILQRLSSGTLDHHRHQSRLVHASGHIVDARVRVSVVRDADGLVQGLDWVFDDATE